LGKLINLHILSKKKVGTHHTMGTMDYVGKILGVASFTGIKILTTEQNREHLT